MPRLQKKKKKASLPGKQSLRRRLVCRKCTSGQYMRICSTGRERMKQNWTEGGKDKCQLTPWQALKQGELFRVSPIGDEEARILHLISSHPSLPPQPHQFIMKCSLILERILTGSGDSLLLKAILPKSWYLGTVYWQ